MAGDFFAAITFLKQAGANLLRSFVRSHPGAVYSDLRFEVMWGRSGSAEGGQPRSMMQREEASLGVSVHCEADKGGFAVGSSGTSAGALALKHDKLASAVGVALQDAYERARLGARESAALRRRYGDRLGSLSHGVPRPAMAARDEVPAIFLRDPREVSAQELRRLLDETSAAVNRLGGEIAFDHISALIELREEFFADSQGASILQAFAFSQGDCYIVAQSGSGHQEIYDTIGQQRGFECLEQGCPGKLMPNPDLQTFAVGLAKEAIELAAAPILKAPAGEVTVVTDPHFNALLVHEIVGHPSEADRALKMEAAYAGRSWFLRSATDSEVGNQVASTLLSAGSDPLLDGYGHYRYDHEGTPARRVAHIERGIFRGFLNSRSTAQALGVEPNGSARASEARFVPLVRMSNTFFEPGESTPEQIIAEVDRGYYVSGSLIPSIAESRENFRISARKVYQIEHGRLGRLFRAGSVIGDSRRFFLDVDAVGSDLRLIAIPNCGKGQPMQVKRMSNGGPTLRSRARLAGSK